MSAKRESICSGRRQSGRMGVGDGIWGEVSHGWEEADQAAKMLPIANGAEAR